MSFYILLFIYICFYFYFYFFCFILYIFFLFYYFLYFFIYYLVGWCFNVFPHHLYLSSFCRDHLFLFKIINLFPSLGQIYNLAELPFFFLLIIPSFLCLIVIRYVLLVGKPMSFFAILFLFFTFMILDCSFFVLFQLSIIIARLSEVPISHP